MDLESERKESAMGARVQLCCVVVVGASCWHGSGAMGAVIKRVGPDIPIPKLEPDPSDDSQTDDVTYKLDGTFWGQFEGEESDSEIKKTFSNFLGGSLIVNWYTIEIELPHIDLDFDALDEILVPIRKILGAVDVGGTFGPAPAGTALLEASITTETDEVFPMDIIPLTDLNADVPMQVMAGDLEVDLDWNILDHIAEEDRVGDYFLLAADVPLLDMFPALPAPSSMFVVGGLGLLGVRRRR